MATTTIKSNIHDLGPDTTILTLIHGYPQSGLEWRYMVPLLAKHVSLYVPELPGYGHSAPLADGSKRAVGAALMNDLQQKFKISPSNPRKVILGGHDRGARICHRLAVDKARYPALNVVGTILLDIVPTKVQWEAGADPIIAKGYYHWPLLANVDISVALIKAYGGAKWCEDAHTRIGGSNPEGQKRIFDGGAVDAYCANFSDEEVLKATAEDYAAGATVDVEQQTDDQKNGRRIEVPTLVMFSQEKLGARQDVAGIWKDWIKEGVEYEGVGVGEGYGHYLPEEAYDIVTPKVIEFISKHA